MSKKNNKSFYNFKFLTIYTLIVVLLSFIVTYFFINNLKPKENKTNANIEKLSTEYYVSKPNEENENVILHGSRDKKKIALTFDAEMTEGMKLNYLSGRVKSSYDPRIVEVLNQTNTKATFFLTGMWIELYPKVTKELAQNPLFELGSHSYTDTSYNGPCFGLKQIPDSLNVEQVGSTEKLLREHARIDNQLFRFPGGCYNKEDIKTVKESGDIIVHWDVAGSDGFNENAKSIVSNVVKNTQNGSIIVLHLNGAPTAPKTAEALPEIILILKKNGYEFVKVNELLGLPKENTSTNF